MKLQLRETEIPKHLRKFFRPCGVKPKDNFLMPARCALALQADGWWVRSEIVWAKGCSLSDKYSGSVMPASVRDRPTDGHEMLYLLTKAPRYFYDQDAVRERTGREATPEEYANADGRDAPKGDLTEGINAGFGSKRDSFTHPAGRNLRTVWLINPQPYAAAHFATFPERLVEPCLKSRPLVVGHGVVSDHRLKEKA